MGDDLERSRAVQQATARDVKIPERRFLEGPEKEQAERWLAEAVEMAKKATCKRARCGSVIVSEDQIIGRGFNSPAGNREENRRCDDDRSAYSPKVTDRTCCPHAELRAIMDALRENPDKVVGASLYFARLDDKDDLKPSGEPYCTGCSRAALDAGISKFVLQHAEGICSYDTTDYNNRSYDTTRGKEDVE